MIGVRCEFASFGLFIVFVSRVFALCDLRVGLRCFCLSLLVYCDFACVLFGDLLFEVLVT